MAKLKNIKKSNKESKQRTVINTHKLEWVKQLRAFQKRERVLEEEINTFIHQNPALSTAPLRSGAISNLKALPPSEKFEGETPGEDDGVDEEDEDEVEGVITMMDLQTSKFH